MRAFIHKRHHIGNISARQEFYKIL